MFKGIETTVLSQSLVQVVVGFGFPSAEQFKVNSVGAVTFRSFEVIMLFGVAKKSNHSPHLTKVMLQCSHLHKHHLKGEALITVTCNAEDLSQISSQSVRVTESS